MIMKKLIVLLLVVLASLAVNTAYSQVHVSVGIGTPVVYERDYPGYAYYNYPAWHGHYRDRLYYAHYKPAFEREHRAYFRGRTFDHNRFEHDGGHRWHDDRGHGDRGAGHH